MGKHSETNEKINEQTIKQKKKNNKRKKHTGLKVFIIILIILGICGGIFASCTIWTQQRNIKKS